MDRDWTIVGRFGRTRGIRGDIIVNSFTDPPNNIFQYSPWYLILKESKWEPINTIEKRVINNQLVVRVEGYDSKTAAEFLKQREIAIFKDQLPKLPPGEYYWSELIDMEVMDTMGQNFGKIVNIMPTGSNDVLVVKGEKKHLIPYILGKFVISIDKDKKRVIVNWDYNF